MLELDAAGKTTTCTGYSWGRTCTPSPPSASTWRRWRTENFHHWDGQRVM